MAVLFFDTSALIKRHVTEIGGARVRSLTQAKAAHTLYIVRLTVVEITSAITRRQRGGSLSPAQSAAMLGYFRRQLTQRYLIVELTLPLLAAATHSARTHGLRAYDAVQLAAALEVDRLYHSAGLGRVTLVSADRELNLAAAAEGLVVEDPTALP